MPKRIEVCNCPEGELNCPIRKALSRGKTQTSDATITGNTAYCGKCGATGEIEDGPDSIVVTVHNSTLGDLLNLAGSAGGDIRNWLWGKME